MSQQYSEYNIIYVRNDVLGVTIMSLVYLPIFWQIYGVDHGWIEYEQVMAPLSEKRREQPGFQMRTTPDRCSSDRDSVFLTFARIPRGTSPPFIFLTIGAEVLCLASRIYKMLSRRYGSVEASLHGGGQSGIYCTAVGGCVDFL